jgi:hypothetical protein
MVQWTQPTKIIDVRKFLSGFFFDKRPKHYLEIWISSIRPKLGVRLVLSKWWRWTC